MGCLEMELREEFMSFYKLNFNPTPKSKGRFLYNYECDFERSRNLGAETNIQQIGYNWIQNWQVGQLTQIWLIHIESESITVDCNNKIIIHEINFNKLKIQRVNYTIYVICVC